MKNYVIVGASSRGLKMYAMPMAEKYSDVAKLTGVFDPNWKRSEYLKKKTGNNVKVYRDFDKMITEEKPDAVIVTTVDRYHHEYIIKALEAGCTAITEKPMTIDAEKSNSIMDAEKKTGQRVRVTFNARCTPINTKIKELIKSGTIGDVYSIHFEWFLDTVHGADYFRRWHRKMENSGGLLIHKSTHHFDMVNWFIDDDPEIVTAYGALNHYGPVTEKKGERCLTCKYKDVCRFYFDITRPKFKEMYLECEDVDGYFRDSCVFSDEIDIYDTVSMNVKYLKGATMSYSLTAHSPYEGYRISINGSDGRIEGESIHDTSNTFGGDIYTGLKIFNRKGEEISIKVPHLSGSHGGSDDILLKLLLKDDVPDPLGYAAGSKEGAMSLVIGDAGNKSIEREQPVYVRDLIAE